MKKILFFMLITSSVYAQEKFTSVNKVRSIDVRKDEATITFWNTNKVYRMPANSKSIPCLENGWKAQQEVQLQFVKNTDAIVDCKLYTDGK